MRHPTQRLAPISLVASLAFLSGCAALVFQVAWMRELRLIFGATTASVAAVLAIFMAGLGAGSAILGKRADQAANPLRMYGVLEVAIALSVAVSPWLIDLARLIYIGLGGQESLGLSGATAIRLLLAAAVMLVPTFLMGGTLPAAVRSITRDMDEHRRGLGVLYGSNTLGAVFGAAMATFFALENLGTRATLWLACLLGLCAGVIAIFRARRLDPASKATATPAGEQARAPATDRLADEIDGNARFRPWLIYLTAATLGFTFFALELVWYRMLGPILGGTAFTFGLILCVALFGIGVGGLTYNVVFRRLQPTWSALAVTCGCEALFTIVPYMLGDRLALRAGWIAQSATSFGELVQGWTYITSIVVLPVALISGLQFPLLIALLGQGRHGISRQLGMTYAWNTLGAIAGSLVAGFGAMPLLGAPDMWLAIALLLAILSLGILVGAPQTDRRTVALVAALAIVTAGAILARGPSYAWRHSSIGAGRSGLPPESQPNRVQQWLNESRRAIVWDADGIESSVGIHSVDGFGFIVNGKNDGNALSDAGTQIGVSVLGAVLHDDPKTALVIGLGTGESAGWLAQMRNIEHVDVVELEPAIDEMASRCRDLNWDVLHHPRVRRIYNDGREFVFTTSNKYDLIVSEPSNPYRAGIAALYTSEFYRAVIERLNPRGVFVQWLQAYEISDETFHNVLATVGREFQHVEVWQTLPPDLQLVCSNEPLDYTAAELRERLGARGLPEALANGWSAYDLEGFLAHFIAGPDWARETAATSTIASNTDDRTLLEYGFGKTLGQSTRFSVEATRKSLRQRDFHRPALSDASIDWNRVEVSRQAFNALHGGEMTVDLLPEKRDEELVRAIRDCAAGRYAAAAEKWPSDYRQPTDSIQRLWLAKCYAELARPEFPQLITEVEERHPTESAALRAVYHARKNEWPDAAQSLERLLTRLADDPWFVPRMVDDGLLHVVSTAKFAPANAQELYDRLSQPFAAHALNFQRQAIRIFVADQLGPGRVVEALAEMEPNIVWTPEMLELRARSYAATHHPLAQPAERDWQWYRRHQTSEERRLLQ